VIPLNQLVPECLLALGGAFLLGNLAAYIRLRPAWRDVKQTRRDQGGGGARAAAKSASTRLPSRARVLTRVLTNVLVGLVVSVASLASLIRG